MAGIAQIFLMTITVPVDLVTQTKTAQVILIIVSLAQILKMILIAFVNLMGVAQTTMFVF